MLKSKITACFFSVVAIVSLLAVGAAPAFSQTAPTAPTAQLNVTGKNSAEGAAPYVTVNGENSPNDSRLMSPAAVAVPAGTTAVISLGRAGQIELAPGTVADIAFTDNAVTVKLTGGRVRATSPANAELKVETADGVILNDRAQPTVFIAEIIGGATGVSTEAGVARVNGVPLGAGKVWTSDPKMKAKFLASTGKRIKKNSGRTFLRYALFGAAGAGVGVLIGLAARR